MLKVNLIKFYILRKSTFALIQFIEQLMYLMHPSYK